MSETKDLGDLCLSIACYTRNGEAKTRNLKLGKLMDTDGRMWIAMPGHVLSPGIVVEHRIAMAEFKRARGQTTGPLTTSGDLTVTVMKPSGKPAAVPSQNSGSEPFDGADLDDIPF